MFRGTTPTLEFVLPFDTNLLSEAYVTISQRKQIVIDKSMQQCECNENKLIVKLSQEETLKLLCTDMAEVQIRAKTLTGDALASEIIRVWVSEILKDGVI